MEQIIQQFQPILAIQRRGSHPQPLEAVEQIHLNAFQTRLGCFVVFRVHPKGQVLALGQTIVALRQLLLKHLRVFVPDIIETVVPVRNQNALLKVFRVRGQIQERELQMNPAVKVIEKITPAFKDGGLVVILRQLVIDVLKLDGFCVIAVGDTAEAVRPHPLIWNGFLRGVGAFLLLLPLAHQCPQLLFFSLCQFDFSFFFGFQEFFAPPGGIGCFGRWPCKN